MNSPINETEWNLPGATSAGGGYPVEVQPQGLPTGTPYKFEFGTTQYSAKSPDPVLIPSVAAGLVQLTGASAPGSTPGWEYDASPVTVIVPQDVIVNLTFSTQVNLTAPARTVSIHALNLTTGLPWTAEFNGTIYSQSVPWLNVSERPGLYGLTSWSVNSTTGNAQYAPVNPSSVNFEKQTEYNFSFEPSYRVATTASSGGTVQLGTGKAGSGASAFYKSGATVTVTATPAAGDEFLGFTGTGVGSYTGNGTHVGSQYTATVTANGPIQEGASFGLQPATRYNITFVSKDLPSGVWWTVSLDGLQYSTAASTLTVTGLYVHNAPGGIGTYKFAVGYAYENGTNGTRYIPGGFPSTVWANATGVTTYRIVWATQYEVTLASTAGGSVTGSAGTARVAAGSFWESANATVAAIATKQFRVSVPGLERDGDGFGDEHGDVDPVPGHGVGDGGRAVRADPVSHTAPVCRGLRDDDAGATGDDVDADGLELDEQLAVLERHDVAERHGTQQRDLHAEDLDRLRAGRADPVCGGGAAGDGIGGGPEHDAAAVVFDGVLGEHRGVDAGHGDGDARGIERGGVALGMVYGADGAGTERDGDGQQPVRGLGGERERELHREPVEPDAHADGTSAGGGGVRAAGAGDEADGRVLQHGAVVGDPRGGRVRGGPVARDRGLPPPQGGRERDDEGDGPVESAIVRGHIGPGHER